MALRVGMVGAGRVANVHLRAIGGTEAVEVVGILDRNQALAREQAEKNRIGRVYASWDELLKDEAVQCVATLLPHDLHEQYATDALAAGKHVVCEKPLAPTVAECDRMLAAAERAGCRLFPVHNRVYDLAIERMHEIDVTQADSAAGFRRMWEDYARGMLENAPTRQTGEDGKRAVEIVNAAYLSNQTGRTVDLPLTG
jgi:predicted dehydrogenase